ncbi:MAG: arylsulfatase [Verrucomicrobia bacterium]|nr:arylsulfatase [Verrucomicrobiota bacterium]
MRAIRLYFSLLAFVITVGAGPIGAAPSAVAPRPNVLLILVDDLGFSDLGAYGGEIRTPNLDRLAADGLRFTQFYNCAVCVTSRAALTTGLYPRQGKGGLLRDNMVTIGEVMRQAGYATSLIGKWHLGGAAPLRPIDRGFDEFYGLLDGCSNHFNPAQPDPTFYNGGATRLFAHHDKRVTEFPRDFYTTDAFSARAAEFIRRTTRAGRPFFLNLCYTAPHFPLQAPAEDVARYRGKYRDGYDVLRYRRFQRQIELGIIDPAVTKLSPVDRKTGTFRYEYEVTPWERLDAATRKREEERMEVYAAMVDRLDQGIGQVLAALEGSGSAHNTVVFFLSDNGGCATWPANETEFIAHNRGLPVGDARGYEFVGPGWGWAQNAPFRRHKTWTYEGGICTPMIVRWPGVAPAGAITSAPGHLVDFMPTLLEIAGGGYPSNVNGRSTLPMDGRSLMPAVRGRPAGPRQLPLFWELYGNRAVRDGEWKLVWGASDKRWELYHLAKDRSETVNLAGEHPARVVAMAADWAQWAEQTGALAR